MVMNSQATFKASWKLRFEVLDTTIALYNENGNIINEVHMMRQRNRFAFSHIKEMDAFVLELPYGPDGKYCMLIVLPSPGRFITEVYRKLMKLSLVNIMDRLGKDTQNFGLENIEVRIPRFEIKTYLESSLDTALTKMGMSEIFDWELADFSRLTEEWVYVSTVDHYASVHVNESGAVASSGTTVVFVDTLDKTTSDSGGGRSSATENPIYSPGFIANRPFIYLVIEKTLNLLCMVGLMESLQRNV
ncbi:Serine protease inhibitor 77Ba [Eumeta japonica]|uniref:Serine protease inhibitor 77Ba n=1 Tax=Eumeta variegata TaxID=151549 RepID=A0A4C1Z121_EUMVA|nr:Serine protease inhibitor 77Ba [Eumeta japonica]